MLYVKGQRRQEEKKNKGREESLERIREKEDMHNRYTTRENHNSPKMCARKGALESLKNDGELEKEWQVYSYV